MYLSSDDISAFFLACCSSWRVPSTGHSSSRVYIHHGVAVAFITVHSAQVSYDAFEVRTFTGRLLIVLPCFLVVLVNNEHHWQCLHVHLSMYHAVRLLFRSSGRLRQWLTANCSLIINHKPTISIVLFCAWSNWLLNPYWCVALFRPKVIREIHRLGYKSWL